MNSIQNCEILNVSNTTVRDSVVLNDEEVSLQSVPLTIDEEKSMTSPSRDNLLPENAVLVQTDNGLLLSMADSMGAITYHPFHTDLPEGRSYSLLVNDGHDGLVHPPHAADFDTRALDKFPDISTSLPFSDTSTEVEPQDKLSNALRFSTDPIPVITENVESVMTDPKISNEQPKRKGGWPKGKKRKADKGKLRAPFTAFVLYTRMRRSEIKRSHPELTFPEVSKILGSEWSVMSQSEKQKYFDEAAVDRQRYIAEFKKLQQSDKYKYFLKRSKLKTLSGGTGHLGTDNPEIDEDNLHCSVCNQYFSSAHNKTEHMYGSKHFQAITDEIEKGMKEKENRDKLLLDKTADLVTSDRAIITSNNLDIQGFTMMFMEKNLERELELQELRRSTTAKLEEYTALLKKIEQNKDEIIKLEQAIANMKSCTVSLASQIHSLKMVPMLFRVLNL